MALLMFVNNIIIEKIYLHSLKSIIVNCFETDPQIFLLCTIDDDIYSRIQECIRLVIKLSVDKPEITPFPPLIQYFLHQSDKQHCFTFFKTT